LQGSIQDFHINIASEKTVQVELDFVKCKRHVYWLEDVFVCFLFIMSGDMTNM